MMQRPKTIFEKLFFSTLLLAAMLLSFAWYVKRHTVFKYKEMILEQMALRQGIRLIQARTGGNPQTLAAAGEVLKEFGWEEEFFANPFGKEYRYDPKTGWVE